MNEKKDRDVSNNDELRNDVNNINTNSNNFNNNGSDNGDLTLIQRKILTMTGYVIIANAVRVIISFKNMAKLCRIIFNSFKNLTQISAKDNSNTLI